MEESGEEYQNQIKLRSRAVQEIFGYVPHWMIRWGNSLILILTIGMLAISYFLRYPNTIDAQIELTTMEPTSEVYAPSKGKLLRIMVKSGDVVQEETLLASIISSEGNIQELRAETSGTVNTLSFFSEGNIVDESEMLFKIIPLQRGTFQGIMKLPYQSLGKISIGNEVRIRLSDTETEQKVVAGRVAQVSQVADAQGLVAVQISLKNGLSTTAGQKLEYKPGMRGTAEIIVENPRLIEHFFSQFKNMFK